MPTMEGNQQQIDLSKGNPEVPVTPAELKVKFDDCARLSLDKASMEATTDALQAIEKLPKISELARHLTGSAQGQTAA